MSVLSYKILTDLKLEYDDFKLVPIRLDDRHAIRQWRNDQISILRQSKPLTEKDQDNYFFEVVQKLFDQEFPSQLLFSLLYKGELIGYGGLVHIDWHSKNAEISFLTATERNKDELFVVDFKAFLKMILEMSFKHLNLIKVHTTVFDLPQRFLYLQVIRDFDFIKEAHFRRHIMVNGELIDVLVFSQFNDNLK